MKKLIVAFCLVLGLAFSPSAVANVDQSAKANYVTVQELKDNYGCLSLSAGNWSEGTDLLSDSVNKVKATVYAMPADKTVVVNRYTNKATASAVAAVGNVRLVCSKFVKQTMNVSWS